jgi:LmbE family N-acetylglucosaminyl deacetylase
VATAAFFHAHPDDEAIATGGTIIHAAAAGHRVVLVCATDGSVGEVEDGVLAAGESLAQRRAAELEAAAELLGHEGASLLTCYDSHGGYGHPDHIQVHRVGHRAAVLAGVSTVYEATMNRDHITTLMEMAAEIGDVPDPPDAAEQENFGSLDVDITTAVDVTSVLHLKKATMAAHASQIDEQSFFLNMPDEVFAMAFGVEWYIRADLAPEVRETGLEGLS